MMNYYSPYPYASNPYINTNPYAVQQERLQALERSAPQYQQPTQTIMSVGSEAEARAYNPDLTGAVQIFVNKSNTNLIYLKQFNPQTALVDFEIYEKATQNQQSTPTPEQPLLMNIVQSFTDKLSEMHNEIQSLREDVINGIKFNGNSEHVSKHESAGEADNGASSGNGGGGSKSRRNNASNGTKLPAIAE